VPLQTEASCKIIGTGIWDHCYYHHYNQTTITTIHDYK